MLDELLNSGVPQQDVPPVPVPQQGQPSILDLLIQSQQPRPTPEVPKGDTSMLPGLALLQFAAAISQPRARGQSGVGKFTEALAGTAAGTMQLKKQIEDQAMQQELQRRRLAAADQELETARLSGVKTRQDIINTERRVPLELERAKVLIENAKSDSQIKAAEIRLNAIREKYADQEARAAIEERQARTSQAKAAAVMNQEHARFYKTQAEEYLKAIQLRRQGVGANPRNFEVVEGLPGEPRKLHDKNTGQTFLEPMAPADALSYAKRQVEAMHEVTPYANEKEKKAAIHSMYQQLIKGTLPAPGATQGGAPQAGAAPASAPSPSAAGLNPDTQQHGDTIAKSRSDPGKVFVDRRPGVAPRFYVNGREIDKNEADRLTGKTQAQAAVKTDAKNGSSDQRIMEQRYEQELQEMERGRRRTFSPNVMAWLQSGGGSTPTDQQQLSEEQRRQQQRSREIARGY